MEQKYTTVILPNAQIESLKEQVRQLISERGDFETQLIAAKLKIEKMKLNPLKGMREEVVAANFTEKDFKVWQEREMISAMED